MPWTEDALVSFVSSCGCSCQYYDPMGYPVPGNSQDVACEGDRYLNASSMTTLDWVVLFIVRGNAAVQHLRLHARARYSESGASVDNL